MSHDLIIRNGLIVDGHGGETYAADVAGRSMMGPVDVPILNTPSIAS